MTDHAQALLHDALSLPSEERAELIHDLLASLEPEPLDDQDEVSEAWRQELEHRARRANGSESTTRSWSTVRDAVRNEIAGA